MAIILSGVRIALAQNEQAVINKAIKKLGVHQSNIRQAYVAKTSLDARKRNNITLVNTVCIDLHEGEQEVVKAAGDASIVYKERKPVEFSFGSTPLNHPVVIAGFGPAGMFAALMLARQGYRPIVVERGTDVDKRVDAVHAFWKTGILDNDANVQFGEGGAGTFSDGKLTTRISDPLCELVLDEFVRHGAPEEICKKAKPHIGTDKLRGIVHSIRAEIIQLGGQVRFESKLEGLNFSGNRLQSVVVNGESMATSAVVLSIGHSARDTFEMLYNTQLVMQPKPFSVGARIEHLQTQIDKSLYGEHAGHPLLPKGEYQLSYRKNGRGVYTFCMCPGGLVVPSSCSKQTVVTNGMSEFARDQQNANSALVVGVSPEDFGTHPLDGMRFQQMIEHKAFVQAGETYQAPAVTVGAFLQNKSGLDIKRVQPSYSLGVQPCNFDQLFPPFVTQMMRDGLRDFGRKVPGFAADDAVLTAPETRTSSPLRIVRDEQFAAIGLPDVYPCGEGAGYAGGIMSAAVDGIKVAKQIMSRFKAN